MSLVQLQSKTECSSLRGADGSIYYIDRSYLVFRDSRLNAVYGARRIKKTVLQKKDSGSRQNLIEEQIQETRVYVKQYSELYSEKQIEDEWKHIQLIKTQKLQSYMMSLIIDLVKETSAQKYYLVLAPFRGTLSNQLKTKSLQVIALNDWDEKINHFCLQFAAYLYHIHFQLINSYKEKASIILTTLEPVNLAIESYQRATGPFLLSCSNSIMCTCQQQIQFTCKGQSVAYFAPEMISKRISAKSNVWSFGCILYQLLAGQRLIESQSHYLQIPYDYLTRYLTKRINWLNFKLAKTQRPCIFWRGYWMKIIQGCLQVQGSKRWSSQQLYNRLASLSKQKDGQAISTLEQKQFQAQMSYNLSFENIRINMIQYKLMNLFELLDSSKDLNKYLIYIVIKFAACFVSALTHKDKELVQQFTKVFKAEKYVHIMIADEDNKLKYIIQNINHNIAKLMLQQLDRFPPSPTYQQKNKQAPLLQSDIKKYFPQYAESNLHEPQKLLQYFCYKYCGQICKNTKVGKQVAEILFYSRGLVDVRELDYHESDLTGSIQVFSLKKMNIYIKKCSKIGQSQVGESDLEQIYINVFRKQIESNAAATMRMAGKEQYLLNKHKK